MAGPINTRPPPAPSESTATGGPSGASTQTQPTDQPRDPQQRPLSDMRDSSVFEQGGGGNGRVVGSQLPDSPASKGKVEKAAELLDEMRNAPGRVTEGEDSPHRTIIK